MKKIWVNVLSSHRGSEREATGVLSAPKLFSPGLQEVEESLAKVFVDELKIAEYAKAAEESASVSDPGDVLPSDMDKLVTDRKGKNKTKDRKGAPENKTQG